MHSAIARSRQAGVTPMLSPAQTSGAGQGLQVEGAALPLER